MAAKAGFEPVQKPQAYKPNMASGPGVTFSQPVSGQIGPMGGAPMGVAPGHPAYASTGGYQGAPGGVPQGYAPGRGPQGYMGTQTPGVAGTQTPGYAWTQTPGVAGSQTPGYAATQTPGYAGSQTRSGAPTLGVTPVGNLGGQGYVPAQTAPGMHGGPNSGRMFIPAYSTSGDKPAGRIYYPPGTGAGRGGPGGGGGGGGPPPPPHGAPMMPRSPGPHVSYLPLTPVATGTPQKKGGHVDGSMSYPPSPICKYNLHLPFYPLQATLV